MNVIHIGTTPETLSRQLRAIYSEWLNTALERNVGITVADHGEAMLRRGKIACRNAMRKSKWFARVPDVKRISIRRFARENVSKLSNLTVTLQRSKTSPYRTRGMQMKRPQLRIKQLRSSSWHSFPRIRNVITLWHGCSIQQSRLCPFIKTLLKYPPNLANYQSKSPRNIISTLTASHNPLTVLLPPNSHRVLKG